MAGIAILALNIDHKEITTMVLFIAVFARACGLTFLLGCFNISFI